MLSTIGISEAASWSTLGQAKSHSSRPTGDATDQVVDLSHCCSSPRMNYNFPTETRPGPSINLTHIFHKVLPLFLLNSDIDKIFIRPARRRVEKPKIDKISRTIWSAWGSLAAMSDIGRNGTDKASILTLECEPDLVATS